MIRLEDKEILKKMELFYLFQTCHSDVYYRLGIKYEVDNQHCHEILQVQVQNLTHHISISLS